METSGQMKNNCKKKVIVKILLTLFMLLTLTIMTSCGASNEPSLKQQLQKAKIGSVIKLGHYEQDNDLENGKEPIEWRVLKKEDTRLLVISEKVLDREPYEESKGSAKWENCSLRKWLNDFFFNEAFTDEEQAMILLANVSADKNPETNLDSGNDTQDRVFLLSVVEAEDLFDSDSDRKCNETAYSKTQTTTPLLESDSYDKIWWFRSVGGDTSAAAGTYADGSINYKGYFIYFDEMGVRPAIWIDLNQ